VSDAVQRVLERLGGVERTRRGWRALCPSHSDHHPSLDVSEGHDGRALLTCRAGCRTLDILEALGLRWSDLFVSGSAPARRSRALTADDQARRDVLAETRRQLARLDFELYTDADTLRACARAVTEARAVATRLGPSDAVWDLLAKAAELEWLNFAAEARLDAA